MLVVSRRGGCAQEDRLCSEHGVRDVCEGCFKIHKVLVAFLPPKGAEP